MERAVEIAPSETNYSKGPQLEGTTHEQYCYVVPSKRDESGTYFAHRGLVPIPYLVTGYPNALELTEWDGWNSVKTGNWSDPYNEWDSEGRRWADGFTIERESILVDRPVAQFINRDKYNEWLAPRIASRFGRKFNITHKVTDEGGNGAVEEAKALVTVHTELENTVADLINDRGIKNVQMRDYAENSSTTEKHVKFGKSESTQIQVALNGNIALDIGVVKLSMGLSFTSSSTLTVDHSEEVILEPGMHAGAHSSMSCKSGTTYLRKLMELTDIMGAGVQLSTSPTYTPSLFA
jgi:hypothetical protein